MFDDIYHILDDEKYYNVSVTSWSPNSKHLWLETTCRGCGREKGYDNEGEYYILNSETKELIQFFKGEDGPGRKTGEGVWVNEQIDLIGWVPNVID